MKVVTVSDLHGILPKIPEADLLIIAGDICPVYDHTFFWQNKWLITVFKPWLLANPVKSTVGVWGNHDLIAEKHTPPNLPWHVLTDEMVKLFGLRIYGLPWQRRFYDWAFNLDEPELSQKYEAIPECDIIVSHGPAYGYGDKTPRELTGCQTFTRRIDELQPQLVVTGHIHCDPGVWKRGETTIVNATLVDEQYREANPPRVFDIYPRSVCECGGRANDWHSHASDCPVIAA